VLSEAAAEGVIRKQLPDDTLLVFLSDTHIGGAAGSDIFESAAELTLLVEEINRHNGPVELVVAGDFFDLLRMEDAAGAGDGVAATITRPEYQGLFGALRGFAGSHGRRVVYVVGNHDAEVWWNPRIQRLLSEAGLVDVFALSYSASFASLPEQVVYCEHGNQFDPANTIADYANPLDTPVGAHVVTEMIRPLGSKAASTRGFNLRQVRHVFPVAAHPGPAEWIGGRIFYQFSARCSGGSWSSWRSWLSPTSPTGGWPSSWGVPVEGRGRCGPSLSRRRMAWRCWRSPLWSCSSSAAGRHWM
jgi:Calcineurin-like phosphoesterase